MGFLISEPSQWAQRDIKGGYVQINKRVWQGVVRDREKRLLWQCEHVHSRPEYNARYRRDPRQVWEFSALNCGRATAKQWYCIQDGRQVEGAIGLVGWHNDRFRARDDVARVQVGPVCYQGQVVLRFDGHREIRIYRPDEGETGQFKFSGHVLPDAPKSETDQRPSSELPAFLTAASMLRGMLHGLSFRYVPKTERHAEIPIPKWIQPFLPASQRNTKGPHIRTVKRNGQTLHAVIDEKGKEVSVETHRGRAKRVAENL